MMAATIRVGRTFLLVIPAGTYLLLAHLAGASDGPHIPTTLTTLVAVLPAVLIASVFAWRARGRRRALGLWSACMIGLALVWSQIESHVAWVYFVQHLGVFALLAVAFARTLAEGEVPMVTRFSSLVHGGSLGPELQRYTRGVTVAWALFFSMMTIASILLFALGSLSSWSLFANLLTPVLVGFMFAIEYGVRYLVLPRTVRTGLIESIRAFFDAARCASPPAL